jgi:amidase
MARFATVSLFLCIFAWAEADARRPSTPGRPDAAFTLTESSLAEMRAAMERGQTTSHAIVQAYLDRIATYDGTLHASISINPQALADADDRDRERARGKIRGPLHGIPVALKDNIQTTTMRTTAGALAFAAFTPPYDATLTANLRKAGAVILAKTGMTELANWVAAAMPNNYNAITGQAVNPYGASIDPGGSSSGIGTAANLWAANIGTETSGSILTPATQTGLVGLKPTVGRVSRYGVIPIVTDQDTPGPMAKFVADVALLLGVLEGTAPDPHDPATERCSSPPHHDYSRFLDRKRLRGARIGVPRAYYYQRLARTARVAVDDAIALLSAQGATIVDPADLPSIVDPRPAQNLAQWEICAGDGRSKENDADCSVVLKYGMKRDFNQWLRSLGRAAPVATLSALRMWNRVHAAGGAVRYGQAALDISDEMDLDADRARYEADRSKDLALTATHGIDEVMHRYTLDALLFGGSSGAAVGARAGYPSIVVPWVTDPEPFGITFTGGACSEPTLIGLGYAFEQATHRRRPPPQYP